MDTKFGKETGINSIMNQKNITIFKKCNIHFIDMYKK